MFLGAPEFIGACADWLVERWAAGGGAVLRVRA